MMAAATSRGFSNLALFLHIRNNVNYNITLRESKALMYIRSRKPGNIVMLEK